MWEIVGSLNLIFVIFGIGKVYLVYIDIVFKWNFYKFMVIKNIKKCFIMRYIISYCIVYFINIYFIIMC